MPGAGWEEKQIPHCVRDDAGVEVCQNDAGVEVSQDDAGVEVCQDESDNQTAFGMTRAKKNSGVGSHTRRKSRSLTGFGMTRV